MSSKIIALIAVAIVIIGGWLVYKQSGDGTSLENPIPDAALNNPNPNNTASENTSTSPDPALSQTPAGSVKEFTVTGSSFTFAPKTMTVNKGDTVKINFVNSGGSHDFVIDEFNVKTPVLQSGQSASVTFVADKAGAFEYYCSVGTHRQMGMKGTLTVK
ncbi:cupredoxin domain-containing protein [Candidatus Parcubacteria bacterium]|nr:cupredoxin domain-containing protein [Candidatus Parcubacteria bacterium]